jgi:aldose 1-epimerase
MIELETGTAGLAIDAERGGRIASLSIGGRELLLGPPSADDRSFRWGCFLMAPWPGRLAGGRFEWARRTIDLPRTHGRHAIHGLGWSREWRVLEQAASRATLELDLGEAGWPMGGAARETIELHEDRLVLTAEVRAADATPAGLGWHPWFQRRGGARVTLEADGILEVEGMLPTGRILPIAGKLDLRDGPELRRRRLDDVYVGVRSPIVVGWEDLELRISPGPNQPAVLVHTPRSSFCVEPMTAVPNAFNGPDVPKLQAGERLATTTVLSWAQRIRERVAPPPPGRR